MSGNCSAYLPNTINNFTANQGVLPWAVGTFGATGNFNVVTGLYTAGATGLYEFSGSFRSASVPVVVWINGVTGSALPCTMQMNTGDKASIVSTGVSTIIGGINPDTNSPYSYLSINFVGASGGGVAFATPTVGGIVYGQSDNNGSNNVILGYGITNTSTGNTLIGSSIGSISGTDNVCAGIFSGLNVAAGNNNIVIGRYADCAGGSNNTVIGPSAGYGSSGLNNVYLGSSAGYATLGANSNVAIGYQSMFNSGNTGGNNVAIGAQAGSTYIGSSTNNVVIGYNSGTTGASNEVYLGNTSSTSFIVPAANTSLGATGAFGNLYINPSTYQIGTVPGPALLGSVVLAAPTLHLGISGIPATYRTLKIYATARTTQPANFDVLYMQINADGGTNYNWQQTQTVNSTLSGNTGAAATAFLTSECAGASGTVGDAGCIEITITNYADTTFFKQIIATGGTFSYPMIRTVVGNYASTSAVNAFYLTSGNGANFVAGSSCYVYGL